MERRKFLKYLGFSVAGVTCLKFITDTPPEKVVINPITEVPKDIVIGDGWMKQIEDSHAENEITFYGSYEQVNKFDSLIKNMNSKYHK